MRIQVQPGETLMVGFADEDGLTLDGELMVVFDSGETITVTADLEDSQGRKGVIYQEMGGEDPRIKEPLSPEEVVSRVLSEEGS